MSTKPDLSFYDRKVRPWPNRRMKEGAIVGHTTDKSTRIWIRTESKGSYTLIVMKEPLGRPLVLPEISNKTLPVDEGGKLKLVHVEDDIKTKDSNDRTAVIDVKGLSPSTRYYYAVFRNRAGREKNPLNIWELGYERELSFRTMAAKAESFTFGLYSCHMPYSTNYDASMWNLFLQELKLKDASFIIGGGDQVYADGDKHVDIWRWLAKVREQKPTHGDMVSWYRDIYRGYWGDEKLQTVYGNFPNYMIWDDHEVMDGWGSYKKEELSKQINQWQDYRADANEDLMKKMEKAGIQVYEEYQHSHNVATPNGQYDYFFEANGSDFFVLDMRFNRKFTNKNEDQMQILGAAQIKRLRAWCDGLKAAKNPGPIFLVSTVPLVHLEDSALEVLEKVHVFGAYDDVRDHWEHPYNEKEYHELIEIIFACADNTGRPLVVLSGDVHIGAVFRLGRYNHRKARVFQVTSSGITYAKMKYLREKSDLAVKRTGIVRKRSENAAEDVVDYEIAGEPFVRNNFALLDVQYKNGKVGSIIVTLQGNHGDSEQAISARVDLLKLK